MSDIYARQRQMRAMRRAAMQRGVVAILDVGTSKIGCFVLRIDDAEPQGQGVGRMAGHGRVRVIGAAATRARGVRGGEIAAMSEAERAIRTALQAAQKMAGVRVDHVIACLSGGAPRSYGLTGEHLIEDGTVTEGDVAAVLSACEMPPLGEDRPVLHAHPVNFALDHRSGLMDPRGQVGRRLTCDLHLVSASGAAIRNLSQAVKRCDMELAGIVSAGYAAALSALVEDEKELGAACIDMGGGSTAISVFMKKHMIHADSVPLGGDHVTRDIVQGLQVAHDRAERIKCLQGGLQATGKDDREAIALGGETGDWDRDTRTVSRAELIGIVRPRVEEILEEARAALDAAGFEHLPGQQIVLTGGGSDIPGMTTLAARILGSQVRQGRPMRVRGAPETLSGPAFAALTGLGLFAAQPQDEWWDFEAPAASYPARSLRRAMQWMRANW